MNIAAILQAHGFVPKVPSSTGDAGTAQTFVVSQVPQVPKVPGENSKVGENATALRTHLLALADRHGFAAAHVHRLHDLDLAACAGLDDAQLATYLKLLDDTATRWAGKRPAGYDAAIFCHGCGPVWVHPGVAAALPVVAGWPRAVGCPWCVVRKAGIAFPRPPVRCEDCEFFRANTFNPEAGMGQCAGGRGWNYPIQRHACETFRPSNQFTQQQSAPGGISI